MSSTKFPKLGTGARGMAGFSDMTPDRHRRPSMVRLSGETYTAVPQNTKHYTQIYRKMLSQRFTASSVPSDCRVIQPNGICHTQDTHDKPDTETNEAMLKGVSSPRASKLPTECLRAPLDSPYLI